MALSVNTNVGALNALASASATNKSLETSMARLASGKRINTASDDAAGMAIASRLTSEINGTNMAIRNAGDAQSLINTAEGAHQEVTNILQRMRELAVQGGNDTNAASDRAALQAEMTQLTGEIDRIASSTSWAGVNLLDGGTPDASNLSTSHADTKDLLFQVGSGTSSADQIKLQIGALSASAIGIGATTAMPTVANVTETAAGAAAYNSTTGVLTLSGSWADTNKISIDVNGRNFEVTTAAGDAFDSTQVKGVAAELASVITAANMPGVRVTDNGDGTLTFNKGAASTAPVTTMTSSRANAAGTIAMSSGDILLGGDFNNGDKFSVDIQGVSVSVTASNVDNYADTVDGIGEQLAAAINAKVNASTTGDATKLNKGLSAAYNATTNKVVITQEEKISNYTSNSTAGKNTGALTVSDSVITFTNFETGKKLDMLINGHDLTVTIAADGFTEDVKGVAEQVAAKINATPTVYGVTAATSGTGVMTLTKLANATNIVNPATTSASTAAIAESPSGKFTVTGTASLNDTFSLVVDGNKVDVKIISDGFGEDAKGVAGQIAQAIKDKGIAGVNVTDNNDGTFNLVKTGALSVDTAAKANLSVEFIDAALNTVNAQRSQLGAISNRLDSTISNLTNVVTNLSEGRGRIEDADFAGESTNLARSQILAQASTAMLAQANASKQGVLQLLQG